VYVEQIFVIVSWFEEYICSCFFLFCLTIPVEQVVMGSRTDDSNEIVIFEPEPRGGGRFGRGGDRRERGGRGGGPMAPNNEGQQQQVNSNCFGYDRRPPKRNEPTEMDASKSCAADTDTGPGTLALIRPMNADYKVMNRVLTLRTRRSATQDRNRKQQRKRRMIRTTRTSMETTIRLPVKFDSLELHSMHSIFNTPVCDITVVADEWRLQVFITVDYCVSSSTRNVVVILDLALCNFCLELIFGRFSYFFGSNRPS
jgi:hypothetical protein